MLKSNSFIKTLSESAKKIVAKIMKQGKRLYLIYSHRMMFSMKKRPPNNDEHREFSVVVEQR